MTQSEKLRRMFIVFQVVLGGVLLVLSAMTAWTAGNAHIRLLGAVEAVGAVLFLIPRTLRQGAWILLLTFAVALVIHLSRGEWRGDLLIYAAGVVLVTVYRSN